MRWLTRWVSSVSTRKKWEIYVISLAAKKAKESSQKYLNCRNIRVAGSNVIKTMFLEILNVDAHNQILPIKFVTDSQSLHDVVYSNKTLTEKRLKLELSAIQESLEKPEIHSVIWVCSEDQLIVLKRRGHLEKSCTVHLAEKYNY